MGGFRIERGVPVPSRFAEGALGLLPIDKLELGQSLFIPASDPWDRANWRGLAERTAEMHRLATGRGYLVQSSRGERGGVRVWLISLPARFIPIGAGGGAAPRQAPSDS